MNPNDIIKGTNSAVLVRHTVMQIMHKCEYIAKNIEEKVSELLVNGITESDITEQPKILNPRLVFDYIMNI